MKFLLLVSLLLTGAQASIVPPNLLSLPAGLKSSQGISEAQYNEILATAKTAFDGHFIEQGWELILMPLWESSGVNAFANKSNKKCRVFLLGGLARMPGMTKDAYTQVICHEFGHFLGGLPRKPNSWGSAEGQADYYSTETCLRAFWPKDYLRRATDSSFALSLVLAEISGQVPPALEKKDLSIAEKTKTSYPAIQCRLDTFIAGAKSDPRPECWFKN